MNKITIRSVLLLALGVISSVALFAGNPSRTGTAGGQELLIPVGGRGVGLGGSLLASATGIDALFWNPAGLARMSSSVEATFSQMSYIADLGVSYGAVGVKAGSLGTIGLSMKSIAFGDIPVTTVDAPDGTGQTYSPSFFDFGLTYSSMLSDRVSFGITATLVTEKIMSTSASAIAFSGGIQYSGLALPGLSLGVTFKNVGSGLTFDGSDLLVSAAPPGSNRPSNFYKVNVASADLPTSLEVGLSYMAKFDEMNSMIVTGNFVNNNYSDDEYKMGAEVMLVNQFFVRGGYSLSQGTTKDIAGTSVYQYDYSFGAGVNVDLGGVRAQIDYGYRHMKILSANNVFSVTLGF
jgi:hypothetical protein